MKKLLPFLVLAAIVVTACAAPLAGFVEIPSETQGLIQVVCVAALALLFEFLIARFPFLSFLAAYAQEWGLLLAGTLTGFLSEWLPGGVWAEASVALVQFVFVTLAAILMARKFLAKRGVKGFMAG